MIRKLREQNVSTSDRELLFENVACNLCGATDPKPVLTGRDLLSGIPGTFRLVKCRQCGLIYQDPRPIAASIQDTYGAGYGPLTTHPGKRRRMEIYQQRIIDKLSGMAGRTYGQRRLLDVGCGAGDLLKLSRQLGWEVVGVEPYGITEAPDDALVVADLWDRSLNEYTFDLVVMSHALEHMREPARALGRIRNLIAPAGLLYIAAPNIASPEARLFRGRWYHLDLPRHLYHFTPKTLRTMLRNTGFRVTRVQYLPWFSLAQNLRNVVHPPRRQRVGPAHPRRVGRLDSLTTTMFAASLTVSDAMGRVLPGEIMEMYARPDFSTEELVAHE